MSDNAALKNSLGYACIGLDNPKDKSNIGSALRAVGIYQAAFIAISGNGYNRAFDLCDS